MTNVIQFPPAPEAAEGAVRPLPDSEAKRPGFDECLVAASQGALNAMLSAIDSIGLALDRVDIVRKSLPEGREKDLMQQQKAALTCAVFASRMLALHLSKNVAGIVAPSRGAGPVQFAQR